MVQLHLKRGDESQFVLDAPVSASVESLARRVAGIYNGRLKVERICSGEDSHLSLTHTSHTRTTPHEVNV